MATEGDDPPVAPPPAANETPLERQMRTMAAAVERFAQAAGLPPAGGGGPPPTRGPTTDELVRASTEPSVVKSRNDNNYTALEEGWFGDPSRYGHTDSFAHFFRM